jgi:hypothetical protein
MLVFFACIQWAGLYMILVICVSSAECECERVSVMTFTNAWAPEPVGLHRDLP